MNLLKPHILTKCASLKHLIFRIMNFGIFSKLMAVFLICLTFHLSSCQTKEMFELSDGSLITMRKADRMVKRIIKQEFRKLSKTEKSDVLYMTIDTNQDDN